MSHERPPTGPTAQERLAAIASDLRSGRAAPPVAVREFLLWFGAHRRGFYVTKAIREALGEQGLTTVPDFASTFIDSDIELILKPTSAEEGDAEREDDRSGACAPIPAASTGDVFPETLVTIGIDDPTYRIGKLRAANNSPVAVTPNSTLEEAITLMLAHDYHQLPVMCGERSLRGVITWQSIGARLALGQREGTVREFMIDRCTVVPSDASLFASIGVVVQQGFVLVEARDRRIVGIVTTTDLSLEFQKLTEPFLLLGEIENHVRRLIDGRFTREELQAARDSADGEREVNDVSDLTFGEYIRLLQDPVRWESIELAVDRGVFTRRLDDVRQIRNEVMHFDSDQLPEHQLDTLRRFTRFLQSVSEFRKPELAVGAV